MNCRNCGKELPSPHITDVCLQCDSPFRTKSKTTAVILAVILNFWSWLYTYRKNKVKFWAGFTYWIIFMTVFITASNALSLAVMKVLVFTFVPIGWGFWIWAIVDAATKSQDWYSSYFST